MRTDYAAPSCIEHDRAVVGAASASSEKNSGSLGYARDDTKNKRPSEKKSAYTDERNGFSIVARSFSYAWIGGRRSLQRTSFSSCDASRMSKSSRPIAATNCTPIGSPSRFQCSGSEIAGCPVMLNGAHSVSTSALRRNASSGLDGSGTSSPIFGDGRVIVGVARMSNPFAHHEAIERLKVL